MLINNDILRRLRYALDLKDAETLKAFSLGGDALDAQRLDCLLKKESEEGFAECGDALLFRFLSGFIVLLRGERPEPATQEPPFRPPLSNNLILKKLRIALGFKEEDMLKALSLGGMEISKAELSALFRKEDHKNYKECGDQLLRNFLKGLGMMPEAKRPR
jgi:uncharacterized protein YehS (DUF1456 family)